MSVQTAATATSSTDSGRATTSKTRKREPPGLRARATCRAPSASPLKMVAPPCSLTSLMSSDISLAPISCPSVLSSQNMCMSFSRSPKGSAPRASPSTGSKRVHRPVHNRPHRHGTTAIRGLHRRALSVTDVEIDECKSACLFFSISSFYCNVYFPFVQPCWLVPPRVPSSNALRTSKIEYSLVFTSLFFSFPIFEVMESSNPFPPLQFI